jgi:peptide chain release factor
MAWVLISSGRGPTECELAVGLYLERLLRLTPDAKIRRADGGEILTLGSRKVKIYRSVLVELTQSQPPALGTICWRCKSPVRKNHNRRNWYFQITLAKDPRPDDLLNQNHRKSGYLGEVKIDTFRSPGKGGQNVNKVETGVRVTHLETGLAVVATTHRTQLANKKLAFLKLENKLSELKNKNAKQDKQYNWNKHNQLERGNPVMIFSGLEFIDI